MKFKAKLSKKHTGIASITLPLQWEKICEYEPRIKGMYQATINLVSFEPIVVASPSIVTQPIKWHPTFKPEIFGLLEVGVNIYKNDGTIPHLYDRCSGFLYIGYDGDKRASFKMHELICPYIRNLEENDEFMILIEDKTKQMIELPYKKNKTKIILDKFTYGFGIEAGKRNTTGNIN